jgi:hypothetical protein
VEGGQRAPELIRAASGVDWRPGRAEHAREPAAVTRRYPGGPLVVLPQLTTTSGMNA